MGEYRLADLSAEAGPSDAERAGIASENAGAVLHLPAFRADLAAKRFSVRLRRKPAETIHSSHAERSAFLDLQETCVPRNLSRWSGASSSLGVEFARQLAERGYDLVLTARSASPTEQLAGQRRQARASR